MTERTKTIKGLISGQVDMGTFGLVELELLAIEKEVEELTAENEQLKKTERHLAYQTSVYLDEMNKLKEYINLINKQD